MEGRPFVMLTVSSPENLAHLAEYKEIVTKLSDPRTTSPEQAKALIARGKTVMIITFNIHSTEIASSQTAPLFLYRMATSNDPDVLTTLNNVILLLVPSQNPDGEQLVVDWYKKTLGTTDPLRSSPAGRRCAASLLSALGRPHRPQRRPSAGVLNECARHACRA